MGINLDKLVQDLLLIIRGSKLSQSEPISKRQIEDWIHQYRALLLKRDYDKNNIISPDYIQEIRNLHLSSLVGSEDNDIDSNCYTFRTDDQIPSALPLNKKSGILYVGTILGKQFQIIPYNRFKWQQYKTYTNSDKMAFLRNGYIYISNNETLQYINVRGVFENPLEVGELNGEDYRTNYPIPLDKIPALKEMILSKELRLESQSFSDTENDSAHAVSPQTEQVQYRSNTSNRR